MGCCALSPSRNQCDKYVIFHPGQINGSNDTKRNAEVQTDSNQIQTVENINEISDSGYWGSQKKQDEEMKLSYQGSQQKPLERIKSTPRDYVNRLSPEHEEKLQRNYRYLLKNLLAKCVTAKLVQDEILSFDDEMAIQRGLSERASAELLIQKLVHSKPPTYLTFIDVLRETKQEHIVSELQKDNKALEGFSAAWTSADDINIRGMIHHEESYILDELDPDKVLGFFVEQDIFKIDDIADIAFKSRREKSRVLLESILDNLPFAFNLLLHALKQTGSGQLANRLDDLVSNGSLSWRHRESLRRESKKSKLKLRMKITLCGEDEQPLHQAEAYAVEQINNDERDNVGKMLFREAQSLLIEATFGSLIIHMIPCSKRTYAKLVEFCQQGTLEKLVRKLLSDEQTKRFLPQGPLTVKIQLLGKGVIQESARSDVENFRQRLIEEFDTVVDEIDPMNFEKVFLDRRLLSQENFNQLGQSLAQSRSARAAAFVGKVLELGEDAVLAFMETIERNGPEYLLRQLKKDPSTVDDRHEYDEFVAKLEAQHPESTDDILFYQTNFHITIHDPADSHGSHTPVSAETSVASETEMRNFTDVGTPTSKTISMDESGTDGLCEDMFKPSKNDVSKNISCLRSSITSDYISLCSSYRSNDTHFSHLSDSDPTMDLDGDLTIKEPTYMPMISPYRFDLPSANDNQTYLYSSNKSN